MSEKVLALSFLLVFALGSFLFAVEEPFCAQVANYTMNVHLDTQKNEVRASETLTWTNSSEFPTDELWFHLYWNAFQNNQTTFLREARRRGRSVSGFDEDDWGYCRVDAITLIQDQSFEDIDLMPTMRFRHPDDPNRFDQTVFSVTLPQTLEPGQSLTLRIEFISKIPRPISRTGVYKDYFFIAQWFPKIGVFENGEWDCHQFHSPGEFYADYGTYEVQITLPSSFIIGATGEHREKITNGDGTTTHHFFQHSVHDFAWTASPDFMEYTEDFEFTPGKTTEITLLLQPYHKKLKDRYMNAVKNAVTWCSLWYGDYPYSTVTCVDPAYNSRSGGMEYPTFFTGGAYFISRKRLPRPEGVTIHEFGHGYFYGLVGSNEGENAWMDEGFTSFLDTEVYYQAYGNPLYSRRYFGIPVTFKEVEIPVEAVAISRHRLLYDRDIMQRFAWQFMDGGSYGANSYAKGELMLRTLKRYMGKEIFGDMIKAYSQKWWFKHPKPEDFFRMVSEFSGSNMSWFLDQLVYGSGKLDYAVGGVRSERTPPLSGWFGGKLNREKPPESGQKTVESEVLVRRLGEVKLPVGVLIVFEDGASIYEQWDGQYRWKKFRYTGPHRIQKAVVDPEGQLVLDINRTNNSWTRTPSKLAPIKWVSQWMLWLQHVMECFSLFGG